MMIRLRCRGCIQYTSILAMPYGLCSVCLHDFIRTHPSKSALSDWQDVLDAVQHWINETWVQDKRYVADLLKEMSQAEGYSYE